MKCAGLIVRDCILLIPDSASKAGWKNKKTKEFKNKNCSEKNINPGLLFVHENFKIDNIA